MTARPLTVPTATLQRTPGGTPFSEAFGDVYHSAAGGLAQSRHVFIAGNGLPERWQGRDSFVVLETGFGLGLNFLATWAAWKADDRRPRRLDFVSVESRPFSRPDLEAALAPFEELAPLAHRLVEAWPPPLAGYHRLHFEDGRVDLTLLLGEARELLPQLVARVDAFYPDGFSPARNPAMWSPELVRELARVAAPGATLATWTVAGGVRAALSDAGFSIEKRAGFGDKREMLAGSRPGPAAPRAPERSAVVIGSGLAGSLAAERLASRDWTVDVVEARESWAAPPVGVLRPVVNLRDAINAQVARSAFLHALAHYRSLEAHSGPGSIVRGCGVLQVTGTSDEAARLEAIASSQGYPAEFLEYVDGERANDLAGRRVSGPGWWFPAAATVSPGALSAALFARGGPAIRRHTGRRVERLEREGAEWRALDAVGRVIARAPVLVLANAADARRLLPEAQLRLSRVRGQVTYLPPSAARTLDVIVSGNGHVAPVAGGGHVVGSTYQHDDADDTVRVADHRENLVRAESMLPGFTEGIDPGSLDGLTGFRATVPDRLPVYGPSALEGIACATGLGSRGLLWASLGAELLASELEGEPLPLPRDLAGAVSPLRFLS